MVHKPSMVATGFKSQRSSGKTWRTACNGVSVMDGGRGQRLRHSYLMGVGRRRPQEAHGRFGLGCHDAALCAVGASRLPMPTMRIRRGVDAAAPVSAAKVGPVSAESKAAAASKDR